MRRRFAAAAGALAMAAGTVVLAPTAQAVPAGPMGGCWHTGCDGKDPAAYCQGDARTVDSFSLPSGSKYRVVELRYSPSCEAIWSRMSKGNYDVNNATAPHTKIIRNSDGRSYKCTVPTNGGTCHTKMVGDSGVTSYAYGWYDASVLVYTGRTGNY
ncbi:MULTISPECIES: DUF2690 domain-containing protein [Streptomyces]|uniref:DUF2690 domain-containing protein n=4 Tax=Streptomyces TaxID=1883 RepID=A0A8H9HW06_9ACTN|nr:MULTISPECIES: DUF2690 domain-containing protein [Streptomyces]NEE30695.1 DUF2690 domain-containing protein [Streptomyces sp. SID7982]NEE51252.1 DUF2690 domain-containing protein [Streptomyces sp. SID8455]MBL3803027.1 DUF2690 domain-containing protein [Streptomyces sp. BRB081]MDQ0292033.1 hypothetical protein [Streptomyces sp. DSM 41037]PJM80260.1 hypothetical protein CH313_29300 [Streptomyces sp. TSRI0384-2]